MLLALLGVRLGRLGAAFWRAAGVMLLATLLCGAALWACAWRRPHTCRRSTQAAPTAGRAISCRCWPGWPPAAGLGMAIYFGVAALLGLPELRTTLARLRGLAARFIRR